MILRLTKLSARGKNINEIKRVRRRRQIYSGWVNKNKYLTTLTKKAHEEKAQKTQI
jgi:hypothetical protein